MSVCTTTMRHEARQGDIGLATSRELASHLRACAEEIEMLREKVLDLGGNPNTRPIDDILEADT